MVPTRLWSHPTWEPWEKNTAWVEKFPEKQTLRFLPFLCAFITSVVHPGSNPVEGKQPGRSAPPDTRPFLPAGGLCHVWSGVDGHPCRESVPGAVRASPEAGQLHARSEDAHLRPQPPPAGDAARRAAADSWPLQVNSQAGGPSGDVLTWDSRKEPGMASTIPEETRSRHPWAL